MAKKAVSLALQQKRTIPIKNTNKSRKLKTLLKNFFNYMKSDTYMFAPLLNPLCYTLTSSDASSGGDMSMKKTGNMKLGENVKDYLKCDCYMYAPLVRKDSASDCASPLKGDHNQYGEKADIDGVGDHTDVITTQDGITLNNYREIENEHISNPNWPILVKHNLFQRETVKHVVHQNARSSYVPG